jgi:hypothetical protein
MGERRRSFGSGGRKTFEGEDLFPRQVWEQTMLNCPICRAPVENRCAHLALSATAVDFVRACIEACHGQQPWSLLREDTSADFTWIESAFSDRFLRKLAWFGAMASEWRGDLPRGGDLLVALWSKDPQRLWWELRDELERQAERIVLLQATDAEPACCPVCGANPDEDDECEHLVVHDDELSLKCVIEAVSGEESWQRLIKAHPALADESLHAFFDNFERHFPSFVEIREFPCGGEIPGLSGSYAFVWADDATSFTAELNGFLEQMLSSKRISGSRKRKKGNKR